ncbi:MAG: hypothetical protein OEZ48_03720 [Candidatus Bathyarchaeota archaeon]|nr:hypothetical protein [Candidatus Bathyarchaeota archaeon]
MKDWKFKLWDGVREHGWWLTAGIYMGIAMAEWLGCFRGVVSLEGVILYTVVTPLVLFGIYRLRKTKYQRNFMRLLTGIGGGAALGFPIWVSVNYILYVAPWSPLRESHGILGSIAFVLSTVLSYCGAAYLMDRLGKRRDYRPFMQDRSGNSNESS